MGGVCCNDRDKPPNSKEKPQAVPPPDPPSGFLTKKPKDSTKLVLFIANDPAMLTPLLSMLRNEYQLEDHDKGLYLLAEEWRFDLRTAVSTDVHRIASEGKQAKVVFFFFDLKDPRALRATYDVANTFKAATRADSQKYLVGYNSAISDSASQEAGDTAADLGFMYLEIPYPRPSGRQLVERMKK